MFPITHENGVDAIVFNHLSNSYDLEKLIFNGVVVWEKRKIRYIMTYNVAEAGDVTIFAESDTNSGFTSAMVSKLIVDGVETTFTKTYTFTAGEHTVELYLNDASLATMPNAAFSGLTALTTVDIPEGVKNLSNSAFSDCTNLTTVYVPTTIETIGTTVFANCTSLTTVETH